MNLLFLELMIKLTRENIMKRNYNFLFLIIWGLLFGGIPFFMFFIDEMDDSRWFLLIFVVIGFVVLGFGIKNMIKMFQDKKILTNGKDAVGLFIAQKPYGSINNVPMFKIEFSFTNDKNEVCQVVSNQIYTFDEVEKYRNSEEFNIKYLGNKAVIVSNCVPKIKENTKSVCEYCGEQFDGEKCPSCGAKKSKS